MNPLLKGPLGLNKSQGRKFSDDPDSARPTGQVDPIPETVAGEVFAYRGMEQHGVKANAKQIGRPEEWENERGVTVYDEPDKEDVAPIPVRVIQDEDNEQVRRTRVSRAYAGVTNTGANIQQIIGADFQDRRRIRVKVKNLDAATVYIGTTENDCTAISGWPLASGEVYEHQTHSALYASGTTGSPQAIALIEEYASPLREVLEWSYGRAK